MTRRTGPSMGPILYFSACILLGVYFMFAAVQGDYGLFKRVEVDAQAHTLRAELALLDAQVDRLENLTRRMSDTYLDIDLLDQQARDILGYIRADEIVIR